MRAAGGPHLLSVDDCLPHFFGCDIHSHHQIAYGYARAPATQKKQAKIIIILTEKSGKKTKDAHKINNDKCSVDRKNHSQRS